MPNLSARSSLLLVAALAASCGRAPGPAPATPAAGAEVLARVNGVAIDRAELPPSREGPSHGGGAPESEREAVERAVNEELLAQRALAQGLDREPAFAAELRRAEGRFRAWRRTQLANLAERRSAPDAISEAEARRYFDANAARLRSEVMVAQMLIRDEAAAAAALREVRTGVSFDTVARRLHPELVDPNARPWELGYLRWHQVPDAWRAALDALQPGQVSEVIRGPNRRFWVLKLLDRRASAEVTFDAARPMIEQHLLAERRTAASDRLRAELRRGARIEFVTPPPR